MVRNHGGGQGLAHAVERDVQIGAYGCIGLLLQQADFTDQQQVLADHLFLHHFVQWLHSGLREGFQHLVAGILQGLQFQRLVLADQALACRQASLQTHQEAQPNSVHTAPLAHDFRAQAHQAVVRTHRPEQAQSQHHTHHQSTHVAFLAGHVQTKTAPDHMAVQGLNGLHRAGGECIAQAASPASVTVSSAVSPAKSAASASAMALRSASSMASFTARAL